MVAPQTNAEIPTHRLWRRSCDDNNVTLLTAFSEFGQTDSVSSPPQRIAHRGESRVVSVHGLFGKTGKSDLALVERIGDNILYVA